jgi:hypothetical protein
MLEYWNVGMLGLDCIAFKNITIALGSCGGFHSCYLSCKSAGGAIKLPPTTTND